jgi:flagellar operon protein
MLKVSAYQQLNLPEKIRPTTTATPPAAGKTNPATANFKATLNQALQENRGVTFSAHAKARLHSRGVELDQAKLDAISNAIDKAEAKGAKESLVLSDDAAYVVSVKNRTVITAFDRDNLRDGVFTAIDSAVIL